KDIKRAGNQEGSVLIALIIAILVIGGLSTVLLRRSQRELQATQAHALATELLFAAEAGISYNYLRMSADTTYVATSTAEFAWSATNKEFSSPTLSLTPTGSTKKQQVRFIVQYLSGATPIAFADRTKPTEAFDQIKVTSTGVGSSTSRSVVAWYSFEMGGSF